MCLYKIGVGGVKEPKRAFINEGLHWKTWKYGILQKTRSSGVGWGGNGMDWGKGVDGGGEWGRGAWGWNVQSLL